MKMATGTWLLSFVVSSNSHDIRLVANHIYQKAKKIVLQELQR